MHSSYLVDGQPIPKSVVAYTQPLPVRLVVGPFVAGLCVWPLSPPYSAALWCDAPCP